jgi:Protein of unknown function (DUF1161)
MKTQLKIVFLAAALATGLFSVYAFSAPLACENLQQQIEQKLTAKGVKQYALTMVEQSVSDDGKKVVGTCAGGTKKILYSKVKESPESELVTQKSGETPRKLQPETFNAEVLTHKFVGTKMQLKSDPWKRTKEVWGLAFSPEFSYDIQIRPEFYGDDRGAYAPTTVTEIRYKN